MLKRVTRVGAVLVGVGASVALAGNERGRAAVRRFGDRLARQVRFETGRWAGVRYRMAGRRPDSDVSDSILADRIRSSLGLLEKRLDIPHIHVLVEDHTALLHGDVAEQADAGEIEARVAAVPGVVGVESYLHVGLLPSDTPPSKGAGHERSHALEQLLSAARSAGVEESRARPVVRAVLGTFADRLPAGEREHLLAHLPSDVKPLAIPPSRRGAAAPRERSVGELVAHIVAADGPSPQSAERVVRAVIGTLRDLVPEEALDVAAVLPPELRTLWEESRRRAKR